jgi:hypothetical protein
MTENQKDNYISAGISLLIAIAILILFGYGVQNCKREPKLTREDSIGVYTKVNDSLHAYLGAVSHKFDSLLQANSDLQVALKKAKDVPEVITVFKTQTIVREVKVSTNPDTLPGQRIAFYDDSHLKFKATYGVTEPYSFIINSIDIPNNMFLIQSRTTDGRVRVYLRSTNPYIRVDDLQTYVSPAVVIRNRTVYKPNWSLTAATTYTPGTGRFGVDLGVYSPQGIGVVGGLHNLLTEPEKNYHIGLGLQLNFNND